jgi:hypothetical protein
MDETSLIYREYQDEDINEILGLWERDSGWGSISVEQFHIWHTHTPNGKCIIIITTTNEGEIIGQMVLRPTTFFSNGIKVSGYRLMAPIIKEGYRGKSIRDFDHPVYAMTRFGIRLAVQKNIDIVYAIPSLGWVNGLKTFPNFGLPDPKILIFDCIGIDISIAGLPAEKDELNFTIKQSVISEDHEILWRKFISSAGKITAVDRTVDWLRWKRSNQIILELRNLSGDLLGVIVIRPDGQVSELIAGDTSTMQLTIVYAAHWLSGNRHLGVTELKFMQTDYIQQVIEEIPHYKVDFRFAFSYFNPENRPLPPPPEWFLMPDD